MPKRAGTRKTAKAQIEELERRLEEAEETLRAIREGQVDALVVAGAEGDQVYTLKGADHAFRAAVETMSEGAVTLSTQGVILYCNRRFAEMVALPLEQVQGAPLQQFIPSTEMPLVNALLVQALAGSAKGEAQLRTANGRPVPVYLSLATLGLDPVASVTMIVTDLTEQKRTEQILASERLARAIIDQSAEAIVVCDAVGNIIRASQTAVKLCGQYPLRKRFAEVFPLVLVTPNQRYPFGAPATELVDRLLGGEPLRNLEAELIRPNDERVSLMLNAGPLLDTENRMIGCTIALADITERRRTEEALDKSNRLLSEVLNSIKDDFYVVDRDWRFVFTSRQFAQRIAKEPEDFIGKVIWEMFPGYVGTILEENYRAAMDKREVRRFELHGKSTDAWYSMACFPSVEGITVLGTEITDRKRAEQSLRASQAMLASFYDSAPLLMGIAELDGDRSVAVSGNRAMAAFFGTRPQDLPGRTGIELGNPVEFERLWVEHYRRSQQEGVPVQFDYEHRRAGDTRWLRATVAFIEIGPSGNPRFSFVVEDITERKRMEKEREELLQQEQAARATADAAVRLRDQFISIASHELKTPLTSIKGYAELLVQRGAAVGLDPQFQRMADTIYRQTGRLDKLISAMLDVSRIERGQLQMEWQPVDLQDLLASVLREVEPALRRHEIEFADSGDRMIVQGDPSRLYQVLENLIQNAIKYSPRGGPIIVQLTRAGTEARIAITDNGIGIPLDAQTKLFSQFYRAANAEAQNIAGLGVGLYVSREIMRLHGGDIKVRSQEGQGSTFTVCLPLPSE